MCNTFLQRLPSNTLCMAGEHVTTTTQHHPPATSLFYELLIHPLFFHYAGWFTWVPCMPSVSGHPTLKTPAPPDFGVELFPPSHVCLFVYSKLFVAQQRSRGCLLCSLISLSSSLRECQVRQGTFN